ncbi:hypothetical protein ACQPXB_37260 [Amycolatopsis sp. CA-161197]|uniref:hypothetical protein n=1 Tax=Amycolatopsis sp. CA-161197 TaxID=3239922 RepID=UPI003D89D0FD
MTEVGGSTVVQIALPNDLAGMETFPGSYFLNAEAEVVVDLTPLEFAEHASVEITSAKARDILDDLGSHSAPKRLP